MSWSLVTEMGESLLKKDMLSMYNAQFKGYIPDED